MKLGQKFKTAVFGDSAEDYVAALFEMDRNEKGQARPDLTSRALNPPINLELKEGADRKGSIYGPQFIRAVHCIKDYEDLFKEDFPPAEKSVALGLLGDFSRKVYQNGVSPTRDVYYYGLIERVDGLGSRDMTGRYSSLRLRFGDQFLVPFDFALMYYVASRAALEKRNPLEILADLKDMAVKTLVQGISTESQVGGRIRRHSNNWQSFNGNDVLRFVKEGFFCQSTKDTEKIKYLRDIYPSLEELRSVQIDGPNNTWINILCKPNHVEIFDKELRGIVQRTTPIVRAVSAARQEAVDKGLADMFHPEDAPVLFLEGTSEILSPEQVAALERLVEWRLP